MQFLVLVTCPNRARRQGEESLNERWFAILASLLFQAYLQVFGGTSYFFPLPYTQHLDLEGSWALSKTVLFVSKGKKQKSQKFNSLLQANDGKNKNMALPMLRVWVLSTVPAASLFPPSLPENELGVLTSTLLFADTWRAWFIAPSCHLSFLFT